MSSDPEKANLKSPDLAAEKRAALEELFPGAIRDGVLDPAKIGELIDLEVAAVPEGRERFGLQWAGKQDAVRSLLEQSRATLVPDLENSIDFDTARNVFIEGDNLEVLKLLQKAYNDKVKLIYIDPPYNTGNDFVYEDDFSDGLRGYLEYTGQLDDEGKRTSTDVDTSGRRHSKWLSMMYPRLVLARNLLAQDGAIFVSIDDNEAMTLRALLDEVLGAENFIGQMVWAAGRKNDSKLISESHEYILVYGRNIPALVDSVGRWRTRKEGIDKIFAQYETLRAQHGDDHSAVASGLKDWYRNLPEGNPSKRHKHYCSIDERGVYFADNISWPGGGGPEYDVPHPVTRKPVRVPSRGWLFQEPRMEELLAEDRVHFGPDETSVPAFKAYLNDRTTEVPYSVFYVDGRGATKRLRTLLDGNFFQHPKDETVLKKLIEFSSGNDDLILDFFAGSGSTAHAVALQNEADGGRRRMISVNIPEPTDEKSEAFTAGFETVSEITLARLKKVAENVPGAKEMGLRVLKLAPSNFREGSSDETLFDLSENTLAGDQPDWDAVATQLLLSEGVPLDAPIARSDGIVESEGVAVVLSNALDEAIVERAIALEPRVLVFMEDGFAGKDALKANAFTNARNKGITLKTA